MNQTDTSARSESGPRVEDVRSVPRVGREIVSKGVPYLRHGLESGSLTAIIGGTSLLGGLRALLGGDRRGGLARLAFGATLLATAIAQRRFRSRGGSVVEETDVAGTGPDVDAVADEAGGIGEEDHAAGEAAAEVADTTPDVEAVGSGLESESDTDVGSASVDQRDVIDTGVDTEDRAERTQPETGDAGVEDRTSDETEPEEVDRLGEAAFDSQSREVPAPQRAFNRGYLAHSTEVFWGIRSRDDGVLVSQDYDAIAGRDGVQYVASSEIGDDVRELPIPDVVLNHWDEVFGGGTAVTGGDDILFVTTDALSADHLLRVLPSEWADGGVPGGTTS